VLNSTDVLFKLDPVFPTTRLNERSIPTVGESRVGHMKRLDWEFFGNTYPELR